MLSSGEGGTIIIKKRPKNFVISYLFLNFAPSYTPKMIYSFISVERMHILEKAFTAFLPKVETVLTLTSLTRVWNN